MNFDAYWDIFKWLSLPGIGATIALIKYLDTQRQEQALERQKRADELDVQRQREAEERAADIKEALAEHLRRDDEMHVNVMREVEVLRKGFQAFQLEVAQGYATNDDLKSALDPMRADLREVRDDIKQMLRLLHQGSARS